MIFGEKTEKSRSSSLRKELIIAIVASIVLSVTAYFLLSTATDALLEKTIGSQTYHSTMDKQTVADLGNYVEKKHVTTDDWYALTRFVESNRVYLLKIYKNQILVYDSSTGAPIDNSAAGTAPVSETDDVAMKATVLTFADGNGDVVLTGNYNSVLYSVIAVADVLLAVLLFLFLITAFMRNKISYIMDLNREIELMSEGNFETSLTLKGHDELTQLAENLDGMRVTFAQRLSNIAAMQQESKDVITSMSHDMRTPMTPLLVYLEMLKDGKYSSEEQMQQYAEKSYEKALQLKNLADNMFQYLRLDKDTETVLTEMTVGEAFYDQLSSFIDYLSTNGYDVDVMLNFDEATINVNMAFIARIFDNLVSNIQRYADPKEKVAVRLYREDDRELLAVRNTINALADYSQSTGFGVKNIDKMMGNMGAEYIVSQDEDKYNTTLIFNVVNDLKGTDAAEEEVPDRDDAAEAQDTGDIFEQLAAEENEH